MAGEPLIAVHPSYDLVNIRPEGFEPRVGGMDWLTDERLVVCCWESEGGVYVLDNVHQVSKVKPTVKKIAEGHPGEIRDNPDVIKAYLGEEHD